jgi:Na+/H+ antiporter NhaD/arsenite permease-like protein
MGMFVLAEGLLHGGALDRLRELLASPWIRTHQQLTALLVGVVAPLSGVIPNTPIVAILLPVLQSWCRHRGISPSRVLIPLSFGTITGRTLTLIGTSSNLLASEVSAKLGYGEFQLFSFTALGIPVWLVGSVYLLLASRWVPAGPRSRRRLPGALPPGLSHRGCAARGFAPLQPHLAFQPLAAPLRRRRTGGAPR